MTLGILVPNGRGRCQITNTTDKFAALFGNYFSMNIEIARKNCFYYSFRYINIAVIIPAVEQTIKNGIFSWHRIMLRLASGVVGVQKAKEIWRSLSEACSYNC